MHEKLHSEYEQDSFRKLEIYGFPLRIFHSKVLSTREQFRQDYQSDSKDSGDVLGDRVQGILANIFGIMTDYVVRPEGIIRQAESFLSSFEEFDTEWEVDILNSNRVQGQAIHGPSSNSRNRRAIYRFVRFRFPHVHFEYQSNEPYNLIGKKLLARSEKAEETERVVPVKTLWKAWSKNGAASGLVAYGFCDDHFILNSEGHPVINFRRFTVANVFQSELMNPIPYPHDIPPFQPNDDWGLFTTSQTSLQFLRSSQTTLAFLVALSALSASVQPIVDKYTEVGGWVFAIIGIISALVSVVSVMFGRILRWVEANAARLKQEKQRS